MRNCKRHKVTTALEKVISVVILISLSLFITKLNATPLSDNTAFHNNTLTTGLHTDDVSRLLKVLNYMVDQGATVLVIEHNLDVIKQADYIIDLGPEGGFKGGQIVAMGTPEEVSKVKESYTGQFLNKILNEN